MLETDVIIVGAGPSGLALALCLSKFKIRSVILEKEHDICEDPRAIALTGDSLRILSLLDVSDEDMHRIGQPIPSLNFHNGNFTSAPYLTVDIVPDWSSQAVLETLLMLQPGLEQMLRDRIHASHYTELKLDCAVTNILQDDSGVEAVYKVRGANNESVIRGKYLVGADGKRGVVRKGYLEERGIKQETGLFPYSATWIAANLRVNMPTPQSHPDFPLWELGYEPEELWDLYWPAAFHFCSDAAMPVATGRFGPIDEKYWRYILRSPEYDLFAHLEQQMEKHLTLPPARLRFTQKVVNRWHDGKVILIGDAAHVFPPFGGQGVANGLRDALALSWRLALLCHCKDPSLMQRQSDDLLNAWTRERRRGVDDGARLTAANKSFLRNKSRVVSAAVQFASRVLGYVPYVQQNLLQNHFSDASGFIGVDNGFFLEAEGGGGKAAQVFVKATEGHIKLSDSFFWTGTTLTLLLLGQPARDELTNIRRAVDGVKLPAGFLADRIVFLTQKDSPNIGSPDWQPESKLEELEPATLDDLREAGIVPRPLYDPVTLRSRFREQTKYVLMRSDFIVFSQAASLKDLETQLKRAGNMIILV
ncbi:hypothetical protein CORC01_04607 [Colletotrichum orchidophilum]|uniref:FAD-binding domain-containing protein n=1 Tax=Colletotrichum orchidophilum TaxID=1209926 RepID=A0A1G4BFN5_9PEZI|nr:uncharacterized protein CORC01_04607 [Colletotrichum orchidophilum]OHF00199.1 hypothetical protein CORC01_04607 [Colletotrichum orchidophilum]